MSTCSQSLLKSYLLVKVTILCRTLPSETSHCQGADVALRSPQWKERNITPHSKNVSHSALSPSLVTPFLRVKIASLHEVRISHTC